MDMTVVSESLHRSELLSEETVTLRVIQEGSADRKLPEVREGQVQEEELDSCRAAGGRGLDLRDEGAGRSRSGFSLPAIGEADKKKRPRTNPESHLFRMPKQRSRFAVRVLYLRLASQWAVPTP
jgi:hypothetical protein